MSKVFSEFTLEEMAVKLKGKDTYVSAGAVGTYEESMNVKTVVKKEKGIEVKSRTRATGTGEIKISAHIPYDVFTEMYGMNLPELKEGIKAYGRKSVHGEFSVVCDVRDEDDVKKLKAYPNCIVKEGFARKIENGGEEVAELELTVTVMPDEHGNGMYEAIEEDVTDEAVKTTWMSAFTPELVRVKEA